MEENRRRLAKAVQDARGRLRLTQHELADRAGVSRATIQKIERAEPMRSTTLMKIEPALGWAPGSCASMLDGAEGPLAIEGSEGDVSFVRIPEGELGETVTSAIVAVADSMTAAEIRDLSSRLTDELKRRGVIS
ncbi:helix-turn-helix domain-containing protein [Streptomyces sp. NPDC090741]|uniref:helix-turn-helix domain-containing protein n=1 Tax=Streptomyces sp. NPDC090741 TaxID=3365967 RepID=UPI003801B85A